MSKYNGLVSIVTPAYNCDKYIESAIRSVGKQTLIACEHIVVDDGSQDGTLEKLQELKKEFPNLKILSQENSGAGAARNAAIDEAKGRYIAFLDSDDLWASEKLASQIGFMESNDVTFSYGDYTEIDFRTGDVISHFSPPSMLTYHDLLGGCPIGCLTAAYNQEALGKRYMPTMRRGQDWGLWLQLTRDGLTARKYPGNYALYNVISDSLSKNKIKKLIDTYKIYRLGEGLSGMSSLWHLCRHVRYVTDKRKNTRAK